MKRLTAMLSLLILGFVAGRVCHESPAHAGAPACAPGTANGNVNGDERTDISDIVYVLNHLFRGGPPACDNTVDLADQLAACREDLRICQEALAGCRDGQRLQWFTTCGDVVCRGYQPNADIPRCTDQVEGTPCDVDGAMCDLMDDCNRVLVCATEDPKLGGCPISQRRFKRDIAYLTSAEQDRVLEQIKTMRIAKWQYVSDGSSEKPRIGFIIDDVPDSPAVRPDRERVDLYGYTSMAVAAIQSQQRRLDSLEAEMEKLRAAMAVKIARSEAAPR
jgi:hypothetical protein